jgi:aryl-alcohol dehydrogenase-like predicted oxidoreductase
MRQRRFGSTPLTVSEVGFGCARIGGVFQSSSRAEILNLVRQAFDAGITLFDTADMYTQGESERLLGQAFGRDRQRVVIATKFGYRLPSQKQLGARLKPLLRPLVARLGLKARQIPASFRGAVSHQDFSPEYIMRAVEASLRRLRTDYIDLYQLHSPALEVLQRGDFVEPLERLCQQGKIRYWGVACETPDDVAACLGYASLASIQVGFSALEQAALDSAIPRAAERGVGIIARQVYASGLLTRPIDSFAGEQIDPDPGVAEHKRAQLAAYAWIAERSRRSRAELALKFALGRSEGAVVLLGMSRQGHLDETLRALLAPDLTEHECELLVASRRPGR